MRDYPKLVCPPPGPGARAIIARDARTMSQNYRKDYPLVVDHAKGPVVVDADGNRYLDFAAGIAVASTGHCHPDVVAAVQRQAARLLHLCATDFYNEDVVTLAEGLASRAPGPGPWRVFFANSGAEVVQAAIKLARLLWESTRNRAVLLIVDAVQCAMARTGLIFASEPVGLEPAMITLAKDTASGMHRGALVAKDDGRRWESGSHGSPYGGNPVA